MKKNKGFTLIELLAVIVILAVLMVIAVPKILNVIENSRNSAAESSIKLIKDGIKTNVAAAELTTNPFTKTDGCYLFDFDTPNANVNNLKIDNKEKAGGSIKLCNGKFSDDTLTFDGSSSSSSNSHTVAIGTIYTYNEAKEYSITIITSGTYKIELWGAQGGSTDTATGGKGAYTSGVVYLEKNKILTVNVGQEGSNSTGSFNGGGASTSNGFIGGSGGGATDVRINGKNLADRIMVAAGGGGAPHMWSSSERGGNYGDAGGLTGISGSYDNRLNDSAATGATQLAGGEKSTCGSGYCLGETSGSFGQGGNSGSNIENSTYYAGGGGGGGYYGGGGGASGYAYGGSGGSSFISGYKGCISVKSASDLSARLDSSNNECTISSALTDSKCSEHYSGYKFTNAIMKSGIESMPNTAGTGNETGHTGNGYAKITLISN